MAEHTPPVSAILTTYRASDTVERALESLLDDVMAVSGEIVVVDDGSPDDTPERIRRFADRSPVPVHLVEEGRLGRADALNLAMEQARAPLVANLDADDISLPGRFKLQLAAMHDEPSLGMLGGSFVRVEDDLGAAFLQSFPTTDREIRRSFAWTGPFCHSTVMYRRDAVHRAGGFDPGEKVRIDHDLWIRLGSIGYRFANLDAVLAVHFKSAQTFFARTGSERELAANMYHRNRDAISQLGLPGYLRLVAALRLGFRFLPNGLRLRITPGTVPLTRAEVDAYHPGLV